MSPKNHRKTRSKMRSAEQLDSDSSPTQTSPSNSRPSKVRNQNGEMSTADTAKIVEMLQQINTQNQEIKNQLKQQQDDLQNNTTMLKQQITESQQTLKNEMTLLVKNLKSDFKTEIANINLKIDTSTTAVSNKVIAMEAKIASYDSRIVNIEKDFERIAHINELKLTGIPITTCLLNSLISLAMMSQIQATSHRLHVC